MHGILAPYPTPLHGNDTANFGQTDACALAFLLCMEKLEYAKVPVDKVRVKPYTIVFDNKDIFTPSFLNSYLDLGAETGTCGLLLLSSEHQKLSQTTECEENYSLCCEECDCISRTWSG